MDCEKNIRRYLMQENMETPSLFVRIHMSRCPRCSREIKILSAGFTRLRETDDIAIPRDLTDTIMTRIALMDQKPDDVNITRWLITGGIIMCSIALMSYSETLVQMKEFFGSDLDFPLHLVLGFIITFYVSISAAVHLSRLKHRFLHREDSHRVM